MNNGWDYEFDLQSVPDEVIKSIRDSIKKWDDAHRAWNEKNLKRRQEELKRLETEHEKLLEYDQLRNVPEPRFCKCAFCPYMNDGHGGLVVYEANESDAN